jgi:hypothetical protein
VGRTDCTEWGDNGASTFAAIGADVGLMVYDMQ